MPIIQGVLAVLIGALGYAAVYHMVAGYQRRDDYRHFVLTAVCVLAAAVALIRFLGFYSSDLDHLGQMNRLGLMFLIPVFPLLTWCLAPPETGTEKKLLVLLSAVTALVMAMNLWWPLGIQFTRLEGVEFRTTSWGEQYPVLKGELNPFFVFALSWVVVLLYLGVRGVVRQWRATHRSSQLLLLLAVGVYVLSVFSGALSRLGIVETPQLGIGGLLMLIACASAIFIQQDRNERVQAARDRQQAVDRLQTLFDGAPDGVLVVDEQGQILSANHAANRMFAGEGGHIAGRTLMELVPSVSQVFPKPDPARDGGPYRPSATSLAGRRLDGQEFTVDMSLASIDWASKRAAVAFVRDASERSAHVARLQWLSLHDELTSLPNQRALRETLEQRLPGEPLVVAMLGIDRLTHINEAFGHEAGDRAMVSVAERLQALASVNEFVARLDSGKFVIVLPDTHGAQERLSQLLGSIAGQVAVSDQLAIDLSLSAGLVSSRHGPSGVTLILQCAASALIRARQGRTGGIAWFDADRFERDQRATQLATRMRGALQRGEFHMVYQPRLSAQEHRHLGFEALMRWEAGGELINPGEFIRIAEDTGFIVELGLWALDAVAAQLRQWLDQGLSPGRVSVNLSALQLLARPAMAETLAALLARHGVAPAHLELEITESAAMENAEHIHAQLKSLAELGVTLAMDDFGTGYSSLSQLHDLPFDVIKIDMSFVRRLGTASGDVLLRNLLSLAKGMGLHVVAEGVETESQMLWLQWEHCDEFQGYWFSRPLSVADAGAWLAR